MHDKSPMFDFLFRKKRQEPVELFYHTDIHCHIMPGVDHGSPDEETSLQLIEAQQKWGIKRIILTPHVTESTFENNPQTLGDGFSRIKKAVAKAGNDILLEYSAEYRIDTLFTKQLEKGEIKAMPQNYLLVENNYIQEPWDLDNLLFNLRLSDYKPIMAHPERFAYYHNDMKRYDALHEAGNLFQINLLSLAGYHGKEVKKVAEKLVEKGYADFLGSDIHHTSHAETIDTYLHSKDYHKMEPLLMKTVINDSIEF